MQLRPITALFISASVLFSTAHADSFTANNNISEDVSSDLVKSSLRD